MTTPNQKMEVAETSLNVKDMGLIMKCSDASDGGASTAAQVRRWHRQDPETIRGIGHWARVLESMIAIGALLWGVYLWLAASPWRGAWATVTA
jgi:hypothetical protein